MTNLINRRLALRLPYPPAVLSPNSAKRHWRAKQPAKEAAREEAYLTALEFRGAFDADADLDLALLIHPPTRARRDLDNVFAALKPSLDGVCAGVGVDDSRIKRVVLEWGPVIRGGEVELRLMTKDAIARP